MGTTKKKWLLSLTQNINQSHFKRGDRRKEKRALLPHPRLTELWPHGWRITELSLSQSDDVSSRTASYRVVHTSTLYLRLCIQEGASAFKLRNPLKVKTNISLACSTETSGHQMKSYMEKLCADIKGHLNGKLYRYHLMLRKKKKNRNKRKCLFYVITVIVRRLCIDIVLNDSLTESFIGSCLERKTLKRTDLNLPSR